MWQGFLIGGRNYWTRPWAFFRSCDGRPATGSVVDRVGDGPNRTHERRLRFRFFKPSVHVFEAHDIVFAEIGAALDLDEFERHFARVGEPVVGSGRNVGRLIFLQD